MLEITNNKSIITCYNISIYDSWSIEKDQLIVEIHDKKYYVMSASIDRDWTSESTEFQLERVKNPIGEVRLVSILKNGEAGNYYRNEFIYNAKSFNGVFAHLFDAYNKELTKSQSEQLVGVN